MKTVLFSRAAWLCIRSVYSKTTEIGASTPGHSLIEKARRVPDRFGTLSPVANKKWSDPDDNEGEDDVKVVEFLDSKQRTRLRPVEYARVIKTLLNEKKLDDALDVLENRMLKQENAKPDTYIYNLLISGCARNGETRKAFQLFNQMKKRGLRVKDSTYTSLFNACSMSDFKQDALNRAIKLRELMLEKGQSPNKTTYHAMIKAYGRCGDVERAFVVADEMIDRGLPVTTATINFLLQSCISNRESGFRQAVAVWSKMMKAKLKPDGYTFNLMLRCVRDCEFGQLTDVIVSEKELEAQSSDEVARSDEIALKQDSALVELSENSAALVKSLRKPWNRLNLLGGSESFLKLMTSASVQPDIKTFTLLLDVLPPSTQIENALIEDMLTNGVKIDTDFCNLLIRKRSITSRSSDAKEVLDLMKKEKLKPNIMTYGVVALCCRQSKEAKQLLSDINDAGFRPNVHIMSGLIRSACENRNLHMLRYLLQELIKQELRPCEVIINQLESFKDRVNRQLERKESGENSDTLLNKPNFIDEWQTFEGIINKFLSLRPNSKTNGMRNKFMKISDNN